VGKANAPGRTCGGGKIASGLGADTALPRANASSATPCRKNCHKRAGSRAATNGSNQTVRRKEKGHVSVPFFRLFAGRNKWDELTTYPTSDRRLGLPEGHERQTEQTGAEQQQGGGLGRGRADGEGVPVLRLRRAEGDGTEGRVELDDSVAFGA